MIREEMLAKRKLYYQAHRDQILEEKRLDRIAFPEKYREADKRYHDKRKEAANARHREWLKEHAEQMKQYDKNYREGNREEVNRWNREWRRAHPEYSRRQWAMKIQNEQFRFANRIRHSILQRLEGNKKSAKTLELIGCSIDGLRVHLEAHFQPGMSWENHDYYGWHIDHIRPCASFDLTDPEQQRQCFHWSNLQPLWRKENQSKGAKVA